MRAEIGPAEQGGDASPQQALGSLSLASDSSSARNRPFDCSRQDLRGPQCRGLGERFEQFGFEHPRAARTISVQVDNAAAGPGAVRQNPRRRRFSTVAMDFERSLVDEQRTTSSAASPPHLPKITRPVGWSRSGLPLAARNGKRSVPAHWRTSAQQSNRRHGPATSRRPKRGERSLLVGRRGVGPHRLASREVLDDDCQPLQREAGFPAGLGQFRGGQRPRPAGQQHDGR